MADGKTFTDEEIAEIMKLLDATRRTQYIGARYVPILGRKGETSIEWDGTAPYEPLTIVLYQGNSYTSRQHVPAGVEITDEQYWASTGNYNAQVEQYRAEVVNLGARVTGNEVAIAKNTGDIAANTTEIDALRTNVQTNTADIAAHAATLTQQATAIAKNADDIATNSTAIDANSTAIDALRTNVQTNTADIAAHAATLTQQATAIAKNADDIASIGVPRDEMLCFGDSWTFGYGVPADKKWTTLVAKQLGLVEHNYGVSGSGYVYETEFGNFMDEINTAANDSTVNKARVGYITLFGGINDLNANRVTPTNMLAGVRSCIEAIMTHWPNAKIIVANVNDNQGVYFGSIASAASKGMADLQFQYPVTFIRNPNLGLALNGSVTFDPTTGHPSEAGHMWLAQVFANAMTGGGLPKPAGHSRSIKLFSSLASSGEASFTGESSILYCMGDDVRINCQLAGEVVVPASTVDVTIGTIGDSYNQNYPFTAARGTWPGLANYITTTVTDSVSSSSIPVTTYMTSNGEVHVIVRGGTANGSGNKGIRHFSADFSVGDCFDAFF